MATVFWTLPDELLIQIAEHLSGNDTTLRSLARTSRRLQPIAEPVLYRYVFARTGEELHRLHLTLDSVSWRSKSIHAIEVRASVVNHDSSSLVTLQDVIRVAPNLRELMLESPYCNNESWRHATVTNGWHRTISSWLDAIVAASPLAPFDPRPHHDLPDLNSIPSLGARPLQYLKRLTLHLNGMEREFWTMQQEYGGILAHPTLEDLHISSINIPKDVVAYLPKDLRSPLKRLTLDEANVTLAGLRAVLSIPEALEYLYIGENRYSPHERLFPPGQKYNRLPTRNTQGLMDAVGRQKHSLQSLTYICNEITLNPSYIQSTNAPALDLTMFEALRELSVSGSSHSHMLSWCAAAKAPPRLQRLTIDELVFIDVVMEGGLLPGQPPAFIKEAIKAVPQLKQLDIVGTNENFDLSAPWLVQPRDATDVAGRYLEARKCVLRVLRPPTNTRIVRPILYGEQEQENVLMYVNDQQGFRVGLHPDDWLQSEIDSSGDEEDDTDTTSDEDDEDESSDDEDGDDEDVSEEGSSDTDTSDSEHG
ncbi:hypothetical protein LTR10_012458 [Elasticomyces elasticus]|nr:hypothetical protein LTR10_012458 [Elasticomyces elasticus]KAK4965933.1 hypothetical protein LTR42_011947 [Elasticomyces elasticus]